MEARGNRFVGDGARRGSRAVGWTACFQCEKPTPEHEHCDFFTENGAVDRSRRRAVRHQFVRRGNRPVRWAISASDKLVANSPSSAAVHCTIFGEKIAMLMFWRWLFTLETGRPTDCATSASGAVPNKRISSGFHRVLNFEKFGMASFKRFFKTATSERPRRLAISASGAVPRPAISSGFQASTGKTGAILSWVRRWATEALLTPRRRAITSSVSDA